MLWPKKALYYSYSLTSHTNILISKNLQILEKWYFHLLKKLLRMLSIVIGQHKPIL